MPGPGAAGEDCGAAMEGGGACGRLYCGSSCRSTADVGTEAVASGWEAKGLEKLLAWKRLWLSALQPANPNAISASAAACGTGRERSNSTTRDMVTHWYATNYCF